MRFIETGRGSFFGDYIYEQVVPRDHFFRRLQAVVDWSRFTERLISLYKGGGEYGRAPYDPVVMLKMLLVAYLYNLSERQVESYVNENLPAKWFVGLAVDRPAPDHSSLTEFKGRLVAKGKLEVVNGLLGEIVGIALAKGIKFGSIQVIDSVHSVANVNTAKDEARQKEGKGPRDPDARWGTKHSRKVKDEDGRTVKQREHFHGYKAHVSMNAESGIITSVITTPGNSYDGHQLPELVERDLGAGVPVETVAGDRGYDDGENHYFLQCKGLHSALRLNDYRLRESNPHREQWRRLAATPHYQAGGRERYKIERKFGEAKQAHGLGRCRYLGLIRFTIQAVMTAMVLNLKRLVKLLTGVGFKAPNSAQSCSNCAA
jgi:IS5 family transposase